MQVTVDDRFCGPPTSGNGGYVCGVVAKLTGSPAAAEVTLRAPPPLNKPLQVERDGDRVRLKDDATLVAEGAPARVEIEPPPAVSMEEAIEASKHYPWRDNHFFPTCFVCGPHNARGLHIFSGRVEGKPVYATVWTPEDARDEFVWAALDCPGGLAVLVDKGVGVLGRLAAALHAPVRAGEPHVITAWKTGEEGRKLYAGVAIRDLNGKLCAASRATWIVTKPF